MGVRAEDSMEPPEWTSLVELARTEWAECAVHEKLVRVLGGDADLAMVVYASLGPYAVEWCTKSVPALGRRSAAELSRGGVAERNRLRKILTEFPR